MAFQRNLHNIDIAIRLILGIALIYIGFIDTSIVANGIIRILLGVFGIVNIIAALMRHCPVYNLAGLSTFHQRD